MSRKDWKTMAMTLQRDMNRLRKVATALADDVEQVCRDSYKRSDVTWEADWKDQSPEGYAIWLALHKELTR